MAVPKQIKWTVRQGIQETMAVYVTEDGIDKDAWRAAVGDWLEATHPDYNLRLMIAARDAVLRQLLNDYIRGTRHREPEEVMDIANLRQFIELDNRIVQIRETDGNAFTTKRVKDATLGEMRRLVAYYRQQRRSMGRRWAFYGAIVRQMELAGFGEEDRVSLLLAA